MTGRRQENVVAIAIALAIAGAIAISAAALGILPYAHSLGTVNVEEKITVHVPAETMRTWDHQPIAIKIHEDGSATLSLPRVWNLPGGARMVYQE